MQLQGYLSRDHLRDGAPSGTDGVTTLDSASSGADGPTRNGTASTANGATARDGAIRAFDGPEHDHVGGRVGMDWLFGVINNYIGKLEDAE